MGCRQSVSLMTAVQFGEAEQVRKVLAKGGTAHINDVDACGHTPLMWAAAGGNAEVVELLLAVPGVQVNTISADTDGSTALIMAASKGYKDIVQLLVAVEGIHINIANKQRHSTALMHAVVWGHEEIVDILLGCKDIELNMQDMDRNTAAHYAALRRHTGVMEKLIMSRKVDLEIRGSGGRTILDIARENGPAKLVRLLESACLIIRSASLTTDSSVSWPSAGIASPTHSVDATVSMMEDTRLWSAYAQTPHSLLHNGIITPTQQLEAAAVISRGMFVSIVPLRAPEPVADQVAVEQDLIDLNPRLRTYYTVLRDTLRKTLEATAALRAAVMQKRYNTVEELLTHVFEIPVAGWVFKVALVSEAGGANLCSMFNFPNLLPFLKADGIHVGDVTIAARHLTISNIENIENVGLSPKPSWTTRLQQAHGGPFFAPTVDDVLTGAQAHQAAADAVSLIATMMGGFLSANVFYNPDGAPLSEAMRHAASPFLNHIRCLVSESASSLPPVTAPEPLILTLSAGPLTRGWTGSGSITPGSGMRFELPSPHVARDRDRDRERFALPNQTSTP